MKKLAYNSALKIKDHGTGSITSWKIDEEKVETVTDLTFLGSKINVNGDLAMKLKDTRSLEEKLWQI